MNTTTVNRNIGSNKGRPRLWLEKAVLADAGFKAGDKIHAEVTEQGRLDVRVWAEGKRKVSGKADRPIIDLTGKLLEEAGFKTGDVVKVVASAGALVITKRG